jgi:hypothetical protein
MGIFYPIDQIGRILGFIKFVISSENLKDPWFLLARACLILNERINGSSLKVKALGLRIC